MNQNIDMKMYEAVEKSKGSKGWEEKEMKTEGIKIAHNVDWKPEGSWG